MSYWSVYPEGSVQIFGQKSSMKNFTPLQIEEIKKWIPQRKNSATGKAYVLNAEGINSNSPIVEVNEFNKFSVTDHTYKLEFTHLFQSLSEFSSILIERNLNDEGFKPIKLTDSDSYFDNVTGIINTIKYRVRYINSTQYSDEANTFIIPNVGAGNLVVNYDLVSPQPLIQNEYPNSFKVKVTNTTSTAWTGNLYLSLSTTNDDVNNGVGLVTLSNTTIQPYSSIYLDRGVQARITSPKGQYYLKVFNSDGYLASTPISIIDQPATNNSGTISISPINTAFNFSNTNVGETTWQTFRVTNTSPTRVLTCDYGVTGNVFSSLAMPSTFTLNPNEYIDIPISFKPTAAQYYTGRFIVNGNFDNLTMSKNLTGTGITQLATISTDVPLGTDITLIDTKVGEYREATLTLTNTSTVDFTGTYDLENTVFQGRVANQTGNAISVPAGQSRAIIIRFIPTDNGLTLGRLTIYGNATTTPIGFTIRATGYGAATGACVSVSTLRITSNVDVSWTGTREFGRFTLTNNSSSKVATVHRLQFSGNDASKFSLSPNITSTTLNPNQSQEFIVYLTSNTPQGSYQGKVIVGVRDAGWDCAYYNIDLIGTGIQSVINTPVLVFPIPNKIHTYAGGYRFGIAFDFNKKNIGASAKYQLYLQDLTDNSIVYNHYDLGSFTGYGPDERCGWTSPSFPNQVTKLGHNYKWYIRAINMNNSNDFKDSDVRYFSVAAPPVCKYPAVSVTDILNNSATASWQPVEAGLKYYLRLKDNAGVDISYPVWGGTDLTKIINSLSPNKTFKIDMRTECSPSMQIDEYTHSGFSPQVSFTTKPTPCTNVASIFPSTAQEICFGGTMQFNTNTVANSYQWYKDNLPINGATQSMYLALTTGIYKVKVITSDGCEFYSNSVAFTYKTQVLAPSVSSTTVNAGQTTSIIATGCTGTVNWYSVSNGGLSLAAGSTFTTTLNITTTYFASCTSNNCTSQNRGSGTITVNTCNVVGGLISPATQNLCQDPAAGTSRLLSQSLVLSGYSGSILRWEFKTPTSAWKLWGFAGLTSPSNCCFGSETGTWKVRAVIGNGSCAEVYSAEASIVVLPLPAAPTVNSPTIASGQTATLTASGCTGTITWFAAATGGSVVYSGNPFTTPALSTNTTYYAACTANGCISATRGAGTVTVNAVTSPCPPTITHSGTVNTGVYTASQSISSTSNVPTNTSYFAGQSILLSPGFSAGPNENFIARIQGCATIPTNGLVAYYPFSGNANDMSGNTNNGTVSGAILANDRFGVANRAYRFSDGNRITVPNSSSLSLPNAFTFSVWVNMLSATGRDGNGTITTSSEQCIFTKNCDGGHLRTAIYPQNGTFLLQTYANNGDQVTIPFQLNQWKMISIVYDGSTLKQFVDGVVVSTKTTTLNLALTNANNLVIGNMGCFIYYFNGILDDFRVYNRALTNTEVQNIYVVEKP
ncbi:MAG: LamG domain-containing protein [Runella slithyformis]|nr:MAG: LamG domain-containing protein [Runella slithyformis]